MRKTELVALRSTQIPWQRLSELLPTLFDVLGLAIDDAGRDGRLTVRDHGTNGCVVLLEDQALARRAALALSTRCGVPVELYAVTGTGGTKGFKFRAEAYKAMPDGALKPAEGAELDFDDTEQTWGGGELDARSQVVLMEYARLEGGPVQTKTVGYKRRPGGRPSSLRVGALLATLKKAKSHEPVPQAGGRVELRIELAAGGKQTSYCTAAEYEEVQRLLGGGKG